MFAQSLLCLPYTYVKHYGYRYRQRRPHAHGALLREATGFYCPGTGRYRGGRSHETLRGRARRNRSRRIRQRAADFGRCHLRRASRRAESGRAYRSSRAHRQSAVRIGHAVGGFGGADDSTGRSQDGSGRRHGINVASAARDSRHALGRGPGRRQAGRFADGRAARQLLRSLHGQHRRALCRAAGHHARDDGRIRAALAADRRGGLQGRASAGRVDSGGRCAIAAASRPAKCLPRTIIAVRRLRWTACAS